MSKLMEYKLLEPLTYGSILSWLKQNTTMRLSLDDFIWLSKKSESNLGQFLSLTHKCKIQSEYGEFRSILDMLAKHTKRLRENRVIFSKSLVKGLPNPGRKHVTRPVNYYAGIAKIIFTRIHSDKELVALLSKNNKIPLYLTNIDVIEGGYVYVDKRYLELNAFIICVNKIYADKSIKNKLEEVSRIIEEMKNISSLSCYDGFQNLL